MSFFANFKKSSADMQNIIPLQAQKWSTLLGGFLIHVSLGSFYTFGNMSSYIFIYIYISAEFYRKMLIFIFFAFIQLLGPYLTSYLREYVGINIRYSGIIE